MRKIILLFTLFFYLFGHAQKQTMEILDAEGITAVVLSADEVFKITVTTAPVETISIRTDSEGEYYNRIGLTTEVVDETIFLTSQFRSILQSGYDKLSAHKVFSIEVILEIPENLALDIRSNLSSVYASGHYKSMLIQLKSGSCYLNSVTADVTVNTFNGNILVQNSNAAVTADSRHGKIELPIENSGTFNIFLSSINGDIKVENTK